MTTTDTYMNLMIEPMTKWLGRDGMAYFQGMIDACGNLIPAHSMLLGHGMSVRNKMRELMGYPDERELPGHFYDDNWERLIRLCLTREHQRTCKICGGTGLVRTDPDKPVEQCWCRKVTDAND